MIDVVDEEVERLGAVNGQRAGVVGEGGGGCHVGVLRVVGDGDVADAEDLDGRALTEDAALELAGAVLDGDVLGVQLAVERFAPDGGDEVCDSHFGYPP